MPDEIKNDDAKLDKVLSHLDSLHKRMDAAEEERKADKARVDAACERMDAAEEERKKADAARADAAKEEEKAKADAEEKAKADAAAAEKMKADAAAEEERKRADAARADAAGGEANKKLQAQIDALARRLPADLPPDIRQRMTGFQLRAEPVYLAFSDAAGAPPPVQGESEIDYRIRLASKFQMHARNPKVKGAKLTEIKDSGALEVFEDAIYADALAEASNPTTLQPGIMIPQKTRDQAGREITRYVGHPNACWDQFKPPVRYARRILTPGASRVQ